jgi:predicted transcriptional regulator
MAKKPPPESRLSFQVPADVEQRLRDQAAREDRSISSLIRRAVIAYLDSRPAD